MKKFLTLFFLIAGFLTAFAQEEVVHSVYFEFDKFNLTEEQATAVVAFVKAIDTSRIESIQIFGYTDDRGKDAYNYKLSNNRANTIKNRLVEKGIRSKIIITIEGRGRILLDEDIDNKSEARAKNRRVDVVANFKPEPPIQLAPGMYNMVKEGLHPGDRIYLQDILFERGSSKLTTKSKQELERVAALLQKFKNLQFEIQGHVCCTPTFQREAIDKDTRKRELSKNRAETVYKFFIMKKINPSRMTFKGYGNTQPLGRGSEYDRRVELVIKKV